MFITGLGIGPTFSVFTIVVQNAVPFRQLGVATSNLTFFRQIGGTIAPGALVGTIFGTTFKDQLDPADGGRRRAAAGGRPVRRPGGRQRRVRLQRADRRRQDLGATILAAIPPQFQEIVKPVIPTMVERHPRAFSLAVAQTFWLGVVGTVVAAGRGGARIKEIPLRKTVAGRENRLAEAIEESQAAGAGVPLGPRRHARAGTGLTVDNAPPPDGPADLLPAGPFHVPRYHRPVTEPCCPSAAELLAAGRRRRARSGRRSCRWPTCRRGPCGG